MTNSKALRILQGYADILGKDFVVLQLIDYYKPNAGGMIGWHKLQAITIDDVINGTAAYDGMQARYSYRDIIKICESGKTQNLNVYIAESYEEFKNNPERKKHVESFNTIMGRTYMQNTVRDLYRVNKMIYA